MDIKQLKSILKVLRDNGVSNFKTPELELTLTQDALLPKKTPINSQIEIEESVEDPWKDFPEGTLSPTQLAFYSSGGSPSDDPENQ
jgi:hypothetical protein